jgi:hypothetical protein
VGKARAVGVIVDVAGDGCQRGAEFRRCLGLVRGRLQARYNRLVRRFGGDKNPGAKKKAIMYRSKIRSNG